MTIEMTAGDTRQIAVVVQDDEGEPVNIADATAVVFMLGRMPGGEALFVKSLGEGIELTAPLVGEFTVSLEEADTAGVTAGLYFFEAEITLPGPPLVVATVAKGMMLIEAGMAVAVP